MHSHSTDQTGARRLGDERGVALVIALMAMLLLTALGLALTMTTMTETRISANYASGTETLYGADAAVERVMQDLLTVPDWNKILDGTERSSFVDGLPIGTRPLPGGDMLDLVKATNYVNCGKPACVDPDDYIRATDERPWGQNNPRWQLLAYGPLKDMIETETVNSAVYVIVWAADDPAETDNNPKVDGAASLDGTFPANPGKGVMSLLAHAYGPHGTRRVIEVTVARTDTTEIERGYTGQRGQDEQNRRARKAAVQTPGKALTRTTLATGA